MKRDVCAICGRPVASPEDWRDMKEGEGEWLCWGDPFLCRAPAADESRDRAIRAVVAAQWGGMAMLVSVISLNAPADLDEGGGLVTPHEPVANLFPTPEQIVDGEFG